MRAILFVPAYEAEKTLENVIRRIPLTVYEEVNEVLIQDDGSKDNTFEVALRLASEFCKITVVRNRANLGYGGTKKKAYKYCIDKGYEVIVMLHGDGQLPPESLPEMLKPLRSRTADIVLGSRMLGEPLEGGMPVYKWIGNHLLTFLMNLVLDQNLTDYHTGYRVYACSALSAIEFQTCGDGHEISSEILVRAIGKKLVIKEVPVPTYYGPETRSCSARTSLLYGLRVVKILLGYRLRQNKT